MFEVGPIYWLQSFASAPLTWLMAAVTQLGYTPVYVGILLFLSFAVRLRPALGVLLALLLAGVINEGLKTAIAFPRPSDVDPGVLEPHARLSGPPAGVGGSGFWSLPNTEARAAARATPGASYGFPSGHVSAATAFCLGIALFFRWRRFLLFSIVWPPIMGFSRMYLGRHFMADVIAGLAVGVIAAWLAIMLFGWFDHAAEISGRKRRLAAACLGALGLAVVSLFTPLLDAENVGRLLGLMVAYGVLVVVGFPADAGQLWQRAARLVAAVVIYLAISGLLDWGLELSRWEDQRPATLIVAALSLGGTLLGGVALGRRFRWYRAA